MRLKTALDYQSDQNFKYGQDEAHPNRDQDGAVPQNSRPYLPSGL
jgi:hypothetical protein